MREPFHLSRNAIRYFLLIEFCIWGMWVHFQLSPVIPWVLSIISHMEALPFDLRMSLRFFLLIEFWKSAYVWCGSILNYWLSFPQFYAYSGGICEAYYWSNDAISSFLLIESWNLCMWDDVVSTSSKHNQAFVVPSIYLWMFVPAKWVLRSVYVWEAGAFSIMGWPSLSSNHNQYC